MLKRAVLESRAWPPRTRCLPLRPGHRRLAGLSWRRDNAELLQQTQVITVGPLFDRFPVGETEDVDARRADLFAGRCNAHQFSLMGAMKCETNHDAVSFSNDILNA